MTHINGLKKTKDVIIKGLRLFYANKNNFSHLLPEQIPSTFVDGINIYDTHPQSLRTFPLIVVSGSAGRFSSHSIGNDFAQEIYNKQGQLEGYMYMNMYDFSVEVEIGTKTTLEREVLMDITASALRWSLRRHMEKQGIIVKEVSYSGESKLQYDSDFIYTSTISIQTYSEWSEYYKLLPITDINVNNTSVRENEEKKYNSTNSNYWYNLQAKKLGNEIIEDSVNYHIYDRSKKYYNQIINSEG